jgi:uncharacterized repeat protein (TIGR03943 family)
MSAFAHRYLPAGILMIWAVLLAYFYLSDRVEAYLHPFFQPLTAISAIILFLLAGGQLFLPKGHDPCCESGCEAAHPKRTLARSALVAFVLIVPLLVAATVSPDHYGAAMVKNRGLIDTISDLPAYAADVEAAPGMLAADSPKNEAGQIKAQTIDLMFAAEEPGMRADFEGKQLELIGQFMPVKADHSKSDRFNLVRMFVICCAADARPVAVPVQVAQPQFVAEMSWVRVVGKATFPVEGERTVPLVIAESVTLCDPPEEAFIY